MWPAYIVVASSVDLQYDSNLPPASLVCVCVCVRARMCMAWVRMYHFIGYGSGIQNESYIGSHLLHLRSYFFFFLKTLFRKLVTTLHLPTQDTHSRVYTDVGCEVIAINPCPSWFHLE